MAPKAAASAGEPGLDPFLKFLLPVLAQGEVEIKTAEHFAFLGLNGPKNAPRTINTLAKPYGYKLDYGKFVRIEIDNVLDATTPQKKKTAPTPTDGADDNDDDNGSSPKKKVKVTPKTKANTANKKTSNTKTAKSQVATASTTAVDDADEVKNESV